MAAPASLLMIIDPETREAYRLGGEDPQTSGPVLCTSREALQAFADEHDILEYTIHEMPEAVLTRMRGRPHWVDGRPGR